MKLRNGQIPQPIGKESIGVASIWSTIWKEIKMWRLYLYFVMHGVWNLLNTTKINGSGSCPSLQTEHGYKVHTSYWQLVLIHCSWCHTCFSAIMSIIQQFHRWNYWHHMEICVFYNSRHCHNLTDTTWQLTGVCSDQEHINRHFDIYWDTLWHTEIPCAIALLRR